MMENGPIVWEGHPVLFDLGIISLPFPVSIPGLILGIILFFMLPFLLEKAGIELRRERAAEEKKKNRHKRKRIKKREETELSGWHAAIGLLGSLAVGQIIFLFFSFPVIEQFGPVLIRWYGVLFALAFLCGYFIGRKLFKDAGKDIALADQLLVWIILATIVGARLGHVIFYEYEYYLQNIHKVLYIWEGGLASHGATIGILLALWFFSKKHPGITFFWLTDRLTIPVILGGAFIRIGNFFNSEIVGLPSNLPWAVVFIGRTDLDPVSRHPTMLYESLICLLIFAVLVFIYRYYRKHPPEALLTGVFMILLFSSRFLIEYTKIELASFAETWIFGMGQLLSIPLVLFGIWILWKKVHFPDNEKKPGLEKP